MGTVAGRGHHAAAAPSNIPRHLTSFVGRDSELRALKALLGESRLVTIVATGGAGKTRLAAELTRSGNGRWPDGIWWIDLAGADEVLGSVIASAELPGRGRPIDVVTSWLAPRRTLLVLDNCEHLIGESAAFCQTALERCPELTILATSREALGVPGEVRWPLTSLAETEALKLFEARARLVLPGFDAAAQVATIARICDRLDRLPLAIEMASARLDMMSEPELLQNLDDRFRVLDSGARTAPERQQTMAATIDWSHRLLSEDEARLFRRLAVFQGGFTIEAAQAVCAEAGDRSLGLLSRLVKKSMVVAERLHDGSTRYRLLESHHDFAGERLKESGELEAVQRRHYDYFSARKWEPIESANFWHAVSWARDNAADRGLGLAIEIGDADFGDQSRAGKLILDLLAQSEPSDTLRVRALTMAARLAWRQADLAASRELSDAAVAMARKVGDSELIARALNGAGIAHEQTGELALAGQLYDEALSLLSDSTNRRLAADVSNSRGLLAIEQGEPARAVEILSSSVAFATSQGGRPLLAVYIDTLANAQLDLGDIDGAAASWTESLSIFRVVNDWFGIIWAMGGLSLVAAARKEDERALRLAAAADRLSRQYSLGAWRFRIDQLDAACEQARNRLGAKGRGEAAWKHGEAMTTGEALDYALHPDRPVAEAPGDAGPLSRREREVAAMVTSGMTNKEIAQRLFIAERTAEGHVERIRNKLGVRSRTEVATWAVAHGLGQPTLDKPPPMSKV
jgi:predicted ATPase/DNA-binding CsgD family transcriptional regulator